MKQQIPSLHGRREFVGRLAAAATGLALPHAFSQEPARLKAAVIGHTGRGDYGHGLEMIFANRSGVELVAVADPDEAGRKRVADRIGAPRHYASYAELLEKEKPALVSVAMRHADLHHPVILAALQAGAHIYCEKPFTTTPAEADELLAEARRRQLKIAVAHTMRLMPVVTRLRQAVREGLIGDLLEMRAYGKQDVRAGGEDMMVLGSHLFDLMRLFAGDPLWCAATVQWKGRDITPADKRLVKDNVGPVAGDRILAQFGFGQGISATFTSVAGLRETIGHWGIELFGSRGAVRINCDISPNVFLRQTTGWSAQGKTDTWTPFDVNLVKTPPVHNANPVTDWLEAIRQNREPECSGQNAAWAVEMVMAVYQAALSGRRVAFPLADRSHPLK